MKQTPPETQPAPRHTYRQRSSVLLARPVRASGRSSWSGPRSLSWRDHPQPLFVAWLLLGLRGRLDRLRAPVRRARPRTASSCATSCGTWASRGRWCPTSRHVGTSRSGRATSGCTAWAIAAQVERPKVHASVLPGMASKLDAFTGSRRARLPRASTKVTARMVADAIDETTADYAAAVADGDLQPPAHPGRHRPDGRRWPLLALVLPLLAVLALSIWSSRERPNRCVRRGSGGGRAPPSTRGSGPAAARRPRAPSPACRDPRRARRPRGSPSAWARCRSGRTMTRAPSARW